VAGYIDNGIGQLIKKKRIQMHLTQFELANISGVSPSSVCRIERNERFPSAHILRKLAKPLGFSENELFILAGFLSEPTKDETVVKNTRYKFSGLDPIVAQTLASESVEVQRSVIIVLNMLKRIAKNLLSQQA